MKRSAFAITLILTAAALMQTARGKASNTALLESGSSQGTSGVAAAVEAGVVPVPREALTLPPALPPSYSPAVDSANLQEQLKWAEQRSFAAEEQARAAQSNIPLLILLIFFALPAAFAGGVFYARYKNYQQLNETLRSLMEKEVAIPPELLTPQVRSAPAMSDFRKGLLLIWSGLGMAFLLGIVLNGSRAWSLSLIPIFSGVAYLVLCCSAGRRWPALWMARSQIPNDVSPPAQKDAEFVGGGRDATCELEPRRRTHDLCRSLDRTTGRQRLR